MARCVRLRVVTRARWAIEEMDNKGTDRCSATSHMSCQQPGVDRMKTITSHVQSTGVLQPGPRETLCLAGCRRRVGASVMRHSARDSTTCVSRASCGPRHDKSRIRQAQGWRWSAGWRASTITFVIGSL